MLTQNKTQRQYAAGRFDDLVLKMSQDPAMLVWLDNATNKVGRPNENYARELMELFTLGIGNYTQQDVTELARAFTGWTVANYNRATNYDAATFLDRASDHDGGSKTILGQTGNWNGDDAIGILVNRTDASGSVPGRFLGSKLWSFFAATDAAPDARRRPAAGLRLVRALDPRARARDPPARRVLRAATAIKTWVRSPVEYAVAAVRMLEGTSDFSAPANALAGMGQVLFNPSDAKGWDWGMSWVNTGSLFARASLANTLATNRGSTGTRFDPDAVLAGQDASTAAKVVDLLADRLNVADAPAETALGLDRLHEPQRRRVARHLDQHAGQRGQEGPRPRARDAHVPGLSPRVRRSA